MKVCGGVSFVGNRGAVVLRALLMVVTGIMTVGGEFGGAAGVQVTTSWTRERVPSFFLKLVRAFALLAMAPEALERSGRGWFATVQSYGWVKSR